MDSMDISSLSDFMEWYRSRYSIMSITCFSDRKGRDSSSCLVVWLMFILFCVMSERELYISSYWASE